MYTKNTGGSCNGTTTKAAGKKSVVYRLKMKKKTKKMNETIEVHKI